MFIYLRPRLLVACLMGFICGLPLPLTASTLAAYLTEQGLSLTSVGLFASVGLPYLYKFAWAPFLDEIKLPVLGNMLGRRKSWLLVIQLLLAFCIAFLGVFNPKINVLVFAAVCVAMAFFSASQDMLIDALRIEILKPAEQAAGASMYIFGYRMALLVATAGSLVVSEYVGWKATFEILALVIVGLMIVLQLTVKEGKHVSIKSRKGNFILDYIEPFWEFLSRKNSLYILAFIILFKLGDAFLGVMSTPFYLKMGYTKLEIAEVVKTYGLIATLVGSFLGGYLVGKYGFFKMLLIGAVLQTVANLSFIPLVYSEPNKLYLLIANSLDNATGSFASVVFMAYLAALCNKKFTATQYAVMSSLASLARVTVSTTAGMVAQNFGWVDFFVYSFYLGLPAIGLIFLLKKKKVLN